MLLFQQQWIRQLFLYDIDVSTPWKVQEKSLPTSERLRVRELPHPAHSENLDQAVRVQSSLHATRHFLIWEGKGPAHCRHSVMLAGIPSSPTQLIPATHGERTIFIYMMINIHTVHMAKRFWVPRLIFFETKKNCKCGLYTVNPQRGPKLYK